MQRLMRPSPGPGCCTDPLTLRRGRLDQDQRIGSDDFERAVSAAGVTVESGDAVVICGGWDTNVPFSQPVPGVDLSEVPWMHEHEVLVRSRRWLLGRQGGGSGHDPRSPERNGERLWIGARHWAVSTQTYAPEPRFLRR